MMLSCQEGAVDVFLDFISYSGGPLAEDLLEVITRPVSILWGKSPVPICKIEDCPILEKSVFPMQFQVSQVIEGSASPVNISASFLRFNRHAIVILHNHNLQTLMCFIHQLSFYVVQTSMHLFCFNTVLCTYLRTCKPIRPHHTYRRLRPFDLRDIQELKIHGRRWNGVGSCSIIQQ